MNKHLACASVALLLAIGACDRGRDAEARPAAALVGGAAPAATTAGSAAAPGDDLFAFGAGARFVQKPADVDYSDLVYGPLNLIDESKITDWTSTASVPAVFVLELPERTALSRLVFDSAGTLRDAKSPKAVKVEVSDVSATDGFQPALTTDLKEGLNDQSFDLPSKPTGRWVRLTVLTNYGDDYFGMTGFRGYGEQLTHTATLTGVSGTYRGASGWGDVHLKQEGTRVVGCYEYRQGQIAGGIEGRLLKVEMTEQVDGGTVAKERGLFTFAPDGKSTYGLARSADQITGDALSSFYSAEKVSDDIGDCPAIPGWRGQAAKSQLSTELESQGRARLDGVNFDFNSATIQPASKPLLDQIVQLLKEKGDWRVTLEGHTDNVGGAAFNKTLSAQRAAAVQAYLAAGGVAADRLAAAGFGYDRPVASNDTQAGRAENRRVEIVKR
jgi:outer membrane protein OmpA-like peptidoglycan-associated protein